MHSSPHRFLQEITESKRSTALCPTDMASWVSADVGLIVGVLAVSASSRDPAVASPAGRPTRFGEGLLVRVLLGMNLVVQEISRQLVAVIDLQLRGKSH